MHYEKNIYDNMIKTIWGSKDILKVRMDLVKENICHNLHPILGRKNRSLILLSAPNMLTREEKKIFVDIVQGLKTPKIEDGCIPWSIT